MRIISIVNPNKFQLSCISQMIIWSFPYYCFAKTSHQFFTNIILSRIIVYTGFRSAHVDVVVVVGLYFYDLIINPCLPSNIVIDT